MAFSDRSRCEQICHLAGQFNCHAFQLGNIGDIYRCGQSPSRPPLGRPEQSSGIRGASVGVRRQGWTGGRKDSAAPQMGKDSTSQFLTVQVLLPMASQFMATQKLDAGDLSARQSVSWLGSDEGPKIPMTSHITRRLKPRLPPKPKAEEPEPAHPRPYKDDPIWEVWGE
ncbi:hypothetical protein MTO96_024245 [Rhipicephalus appendiculatus]